MVIFFSVTQLFITKEIMCHEDERNQWITFVKERFKQRYRDIHIFYGGPTKHGLFVIRAEPTFNIPPSFETAEPTHTSLRCNSDSPEISPIKIEISAEVSKESDSDARKLMSKSLDPNAMRIVKSRFIIKKEPRRPVSDNSANETPIQSNLD